MNYQQFINIHSRSRKTDKNSRILYQHNSWPRNFSYLMLYLGTSSVTEPSVQLDLESGTICRRTSDSQTCHIAVSDSRYYLVSVTTVQRELPLSQYNAL